MAAIALLRVGRMGRVLGDFEGAAQIPDQRLLKAPLRP
jgi:hypothetical protein